MVVTKKEAVEVTRLRAILEKFEISALDATRFIPVTHKTLYNWLNGETRPTTHMRGQIRMGLEKIEAEFGASTRLRIHYFYRAVWPKLNHDQQSGLLALVGTDGFEDKYLAALKRYAEKLGIKVRIPAGGKPEKPRS